MKRIKIIITEKSSFDWKDLNFHLLSQYQYCQVFVDVGFIR